MFCNAMFRYNTLIIRHIKFDSQAGHEGSIPFTRSIPSLKPTAQASQPLVFASQALRLGSGNLSMA